MCRMGTATIKEKLKGVEWNIYNPKSLDVCKSMTNDNDPSNSIALKKKTKQNKTLNLVIVFS